MSLSIPAHEQGRIRVFAINQTAPQIAARITAEGKQAVAADLLGHPLPEDGFELFDLSDLSGLGLSGYLEDGYGVPEAELTPLRPKLAAVEGFILLVFSSAFGGRATTLTPGADLTLIATFGEAAPDMTPLPLESEAAAPYTGTGRGKDAAPPQHRRGSAVVVLVLGIVVALVLWIALS